MNVVDIDQNNAQQYLIDESFNRLVVVDFWADWCAPCKQLMPLLEKLADEYTGAFLLAKINADEQQGISQQLGVRSLPTVMVFKDGQPVDGFAGAQPETAVREMLQKHLPSPWDAKIAEATELLDQGDTAGALALLRAAWKSLTRCWTSLWRMQEPWLRLIDWMRRRKSSARSAWSTGTHCTSN